MDDRPLWAPWRLEYVAGPKSGACIFCAAARDGEGDAEGEQEHVIERGVRCFALLNAFPYTSGHLMVAPYRHVGDLTSLEEDELDEIMRMVRRMLEALRRLMHPDGFNIGLNLGESAGAGFKDHLHFHVVPRWSGDTNFMPVIGGARVISQALDATATALRAVLQEGVTPAGQ
jgi:ATP adenylyltransferase